MIPNHRLPASGPTEGPCHETEAPVIPRIPTATIPTTETAGGRPRCRGEAYPRAADETTEANIPEPPAAAAAAVDTAVLRGAAVVPSTAGFSVDSTTAAAAAAAMGTHHRPITHTTNTRVGGHHHLPPGTTHRRLLRGGDDNPIPEAALVDTTTRPIATVTRMLVASLPPTTGGACLHPTKDRTRPVAAPLPDTRITIGTIRSKSSNSSTRSTSSRKAAGAIS